MACSSCSACGSGGISPYANSCSSCGGAYVTGGCNECKDPITYKIGWRDTLYCLAVRFDTSIECLESVNPGIDPLNLTIGSYINICRGSNDPAHAAPVDPGYDCGCGCGCGCGGCGGCNSCGCS
jgi:hypothetical protein